MNPLLFAQLLQQQGLGGPLPQAGLPPQILSPESPAIPPPGPATPTLARPDVRAEDPDFLRYSLLPLDEQQAQLQQQIQAADALASGSGKQFSTPIGAAIGGLADVIRSGVGAYRQKGLQSKLEGLNKQRAELIQKAGQGPSTLRYAAPQQPRDTSIQQGYLDVAKERELRLAAAAQAQAEADAAKAKNAGLLAKTKAAAKAKSEAEKAQHASFKLEGDLRKEFQGLPAYKNYEIAAVAFDQIQSAFNDPSAQGDIAGITAFMKSLDPATGVKDQEFQNASNAGGLLDKAAVSLARVQNGERLTPEQREGFLRVARNNVAALKKPHDAALKQYQGLAKSYKVAPERVAAPASNIDLNAPNPPEPKRAAPATPTTSAPAGPVGAGDPRNVKSTVTFTDPRDGKQKTLRTYADGRSTITDD